LGAGSARAQLFSDLSEFVIQYPVGDPKASARNSVEGPKGIATADFDGDGNADLAVSNSDGTVTVWFGLGTGRFEAGTCAGSSARTSTATGARTWRWFPLTTAMFTCS
jgi:hypothetical protein